MLIRFSATETVPKLLFIHMTFNIRFFCSSLTSVVYHSNALVCKSLIIWTDPLASILIWKFKEHHNQPAASVDEPCPSSEPFHDTFNDCQRKRLDIFSPNVVFLPICSALMSLCCISFLLRLDLLLSDPFPLLLPRSPSCNCQSSSYSLFLHFVTHHLSCYYIYILNYVYCLWDCRCVSLCVSV